MDQQRVAFRDVFVGFWKGVIDVLFPEPRDGMVFNKVMWIMITKNRCVQINNGLAAALAQTMKLYTVTWDTQPITAVYSIAGKYGDDEHTWMRLELEDGSRLEVDLTAHQWGIFPVSEEFPLFYGFNAKDSACEGYWIDQQIEVKTIQEREKELDNIVAGSTNPVFMLMLASMGDKMKGDCRRIVASTGKMKEFLEAFSLDRSKEGAVRLN